MYSISDGRATSGGGVGGRRSAAAVLQAIVEKRLESRLTRDADGIIRCDMAQNSTDAKRVNRTSLPDGETAPVGKGSRVYLVDGSGYIFRAFHALPPLTRPSDGLPVGAVHGFCAMLWKLMAETRASDEPTHLAVIFDAGAVTFRNDIYPEYKAHRPPPPEELIPQFPLIREAVKAFNVACIEEDGYEADDIIATYAREVAEAGGEVVIVSSDKDLMQLVAPRHFDMLDTMKNRQHRDTTKSSKNSASPPEKVVDVQSLAGDSVDNVPGVPGIGIKTAAQLIHRIWRPRRRSSNAGRRNQTTQAPRKTHRICRAGAHLARPRHVSSRTCRCRYQGRTSSRLHEPGARPVLHRASCRRWSSTRSRGRIAKKRSTSEVPATS